MSVNGKEAALSSLKAMQSEITAIKYYNNKLSSIKKDIDETTIDANEYQLSKADELRAGRNKFFSGLKETKAKSSAFDVVLLCIFASFSLLLMLVLHPAEIVNILGGVVNWIFHGYFVIFPVIFAAKLIIPAFGMSYSKISRGVRIFLLAIYGLSVISFIITAVFRPIFLICALPLVFGAVIHLMKSKENERIAKESYENKKKNAQAKYAKMLRDAEESDAAELARYEADLEKAKKAKEARLSSVIKECSVALAKHKANFKEIQIIPDKLLQKDMKVIDALIAIIQSGKANSVDEAITVYEEERNNSQGEIYVYVGIRRRDGWTTLRNLVYLDGEKRASVELPYSVIKVPAGKHTLSAKVQLNYDGAAHYPVSETLTFDITDGEKKYVKFFVKGSPSVQHVICENEKEFNSEL